RRLRRPRLRRADADGRVPEPGAARPVRPGPRLIRRTVGRMRTRWVKAAVVTMVGALVVAGCGSVSRSPDGPGQARLAATPSAVVVAVGDIACPPGSRVTSTTCRQAGTAKA